jgi:hypothetical protein
VADANANPWSLWKRSWEQNSGDPEQRRLARYGSQEECRKAQWAKLDEEIQQQAQVNEALKPLRQALDQPKVYLREGRTIFQLGPSIWSRLKESHADDLGDLAKRSGLTEDQKARLAFDLSLPEIQATVSVFCAPSVKYRLFPFYTTAYLAAADDLRALGERALALKAKQALGK